MLPRNAPTRFDLQLFVIGVALLGGVAAGLAAAAAPRLLVGGAVVALLAMVDGLVGRPPG